MFDDKQEECPNLGIFVWEQMRGVPLIWEFYFLRSFANSAWLPQTFFLFNLREIIARVVPKNYQDFKEVFIHRF